MREIDGVDNRIARGGPHRLGIPSSRRGRIQSFRPGVRRQQFDRWSEIETLRRAQPAASDDEPLEPAESGIPCT